MPQFWTLIFRVPLSKIISVRENLSLALAFSSSRRPPPMQASNWYSSIVSSKVVVCNLFLLALIPVSSCTRPSSIDFCTEPTISCTPNSFTKLSRYSIASGKLCPVSICTSGKGILAGEKAFWLDASSQCYLFPQRKEWQDYQIAQKPLELQIWILLLIALNMIIYIP